MLLSDGVLCQIMSMAENVEYQLLSCFHENHNFLLQFVKWGNANLLACLVWLFRVKYMTDFCCAYFCLPTQENPFFGYWTILLLIMKWTEEMVSLLVLTALWQWQAGWRTHLHVANYIMAVSCNNYLEQITVLKPIGLRRLRNKAVKTYVSSQDSLWMCAFLKHLCRKGEWTHETSFPYWSTHLLLWTAHGG